MNDCFWKGVFSPTWVKHRDHCGDITNHIMIVDKDYERFDVGTPLETTVVYITMNFVGGDGPYVFEEEVEGDISDDEAKQIVASQVQPR